MKVTAPKPFCFVLMPFSKDFDDIFVLGIRGACEDVGVYCERVDEQIYEGTILDRIYNQISSANIIVADMTARNPNVFYEVGYAHALGKTVILVTQDANDIPFDLKHMPHIVYGNEIRSLRAELAKRIKHFAFQELENKKYELGIELYLKDQRLSDGGVVAEYPYHQIPHATLTVHNLSMLTYVPGEFRMAIIAPEQFNRRWGRDIEITSLPDKTNLHMYPIFETLFPGGYAPFEFSLVSPKEIETAKFDITIRVYSEAGFRDFPLTLRQIEKSEV